MRSPIFVAYKRMSLSYCSKKKDNMRPNKTNPACGHLNNLLCSSFDIHRSDATLRTLSYIAGFACLTPHYQPGLTSGPNLSFRRTVGLVVTLSPSAHAAFIYTNL